MYEILKDRIKIVERKVYIYIYIYIYIYKLVILAFLVIYFLCLNIKKAKEKKTLDIHKQIRV